MGAAVVVDVTLGERSAKPAEKRAATLVGIEWGAAFSVAGGEAVEFGVERVGEIAAQAFTVGDGYGGACERMLV